MSAKKWKVFDFGPAANITEEVPISKRKTKDENVTSVKRYKFSSPGKHKSFDFFKKLAPHSPEDLMVHPKKLQELEGWIKTVVQSNKMKPEFLLISGPTGCGKTSAVQILCKALNIELAEWTNPIDMDYDVMKGSGQVAKFMDFFSESKYCSLFGKGNSKKILLIKDFPNAIIRCPEEFFSVLEHISTNSVHPVIFMCTDSTTNEINLQRLLFPDEIMMKHCIAHISFNLCAATLLKKGMKRASDILNACPESFHHPTQTTIDAILASSMGDIRCAMNQLYLACIIGDQNKFVTKLKEGKAGSKRGKNVSTGSIKHMARDEALGLFHGLGRVLNPKRRNEGIAWKLDCDLQKLVDEFSIQPAKFTSFLFENYLKYFGALGDAQKTADILSFSLGLLENWENHELLLMALWTAVSGVMIFNEHKVSKWNQIKAPRKIERRIKSIEEGPRLHPTDGFYYNILTKSSKYPVFK
ncbi:cell cycle checkpoint protein RAD17 [Dendroctonus ponderosae]|nr:cell cycle checkpoint protein RAD17 [Dendroctonus ponderosae]